jgi:hypothetical protein
MTGSEITFNPAAVVAQRDLAKRRVTAEALPPGWIAGRVPRPLLPIDEYVNQLIRKRRGLASAELKAKHTLGACPYAVARSAVARAASYARTQQSYENEPGSAVTEALRYFKDGGRWLHTVICGAELKAQVLLDSLDLLGLSLPRREALYGSLSRSRHLLEGARDDIASLHKQLSRYRGNVWRLSFVGSLFAKCWVLTGKDPKPRPGRVRISSVPRLLQPFAGVPLRPTPIGGVLSRSLWLDANQVSGGSSDV